jgi:hypothetical protein
MKVERSHDYQESRPAYWPIIVLWVLLCGFLIISGWHQIISRSGWDPDDQLRMVQLRDFLNGQSWFDTTQYRMNAPEGAPMHWSRLIELPMALIILLLAPILGQPVAEMVAGTVVPLFCLGCVAILLSQVATRLAGRSAGIVATILTFLSPALLMQFCPMRIDHHGPQILMATAAYATLFWPNRVKGGLILGGALAIWLHISLEGAPMTAAFFLLLGWRWIFEKAQGQRLFWTILSFALVSFALFFGTQRSGIFASTFCDTVAPPHIFAIGIAAAIMLPGVYHTPRDWGIRMGVAALSAMAAAGMLLFVAPQCSGGAFANLDPLVRQYWYAKVNEGLPVWHQDVSSIAALLAAPVCGVAALAVFWKETAADRTKDLRIAAFLLIYAFCLSLFVFRTVSVTAAYAVPPVTLLIVTLFGYYRESKIPVRRIGLVAVTLLLFVPGSAAVQVADLIQSVQKEPDTTLPSVRDQLAEEACESAGSVAALAALKNARIAAPFDMGPMILLTTSNQVLASSHHRNEMAMHDHIQIFRTHADVARNYIIKHGITHIAACAGEAEMQGYKKSDPDGLWASLSKGEVPFWLERLPDQGKGIKLWRVKPQQRL